MIVDAAASSGKAAGAMRMAGERRMSARAGE
jgi:hypothetical protein